MLEKTSNTFSEIYRDVFDAWPKNIDIADGVIVPKDSSDPDDKDGGYFPNLSSIWRQVEDSFEGKIDWYDLMVSTMFGILHEAAVEQKKEGRLTLDVSSILQKSLVEAKYFDNLTAGRWYPDVPDRS